MTQIDLNSEKTENFGLMIKSAHLTLIIKR